MVGLLVRDPALEERLGALLVPMIGALADRGPDSSGIALYGDAPEEDDHLRVSLGSDSVVDWEDVTRTLAETMADARPHRFGTGLVVDLPAERVDDLEQLLSSDRRGIRLLATGRHLRVLKDTGHPVQTCRRHGVTGWRGHLAIAHTRMATESAVTVVHSHPFVPIEDLSVVHNGSFSNHATVRRRLEANGIRFHSDNDSEVAARFLASRLEAGDDLEEAIRWVMKEMDGFFTLVIAAAGALSVVRDAFACKPAVVAEAPGYVAVASEYRALAELPGIGDAAVFEPRPEEVYTWSR